MKQQMFFFVLESHSRQMFFPYSRGISDLNPKYYVLHVDTVILGTKKISMIACGQTSSMALSDAGEVRVKKDETRKCLFIY